MISLFRFKFDDERGTKEDIKRALEEQYGGEEEIRLKKEQEEKEDKRRYKAQAHLYTIIKVARDEDLVEQIGKDIYFDLVDHERVHSFRIQKQMRLTFSRYGSLYHLVSDLRKL
ncbi:hypothetical protein CsSME_00041180 [Camellia sinensis var. sinensis]